MKILLITCLSLLLLLAGCSKEYELTKSVFIQDPEYTDLPAYSEWGYNTFGAYYDRLAFISNNEIVPAKIIVTNNEMSFVLDGQKGSSYYYAASDEMTLSFKIPGFIPATYTDLTALNDTILNLANPVYQVIVSMDTLKYTATILSGELNFKRAQNLKVDKKEIEVILSGYFEFKALINEKPVTISNGRFDVGISPDNFYTY